MSWVKGVAGSSIGAKSIMAVTGLLLYGFLIAHLSGNLLIYQGPDATNAYAVNLRQLPFGLLWIARIGLIVIFAAHILTGIRLTLQNRRARPNAYAHSSTIKATVASRSMIDTGMLVLVFLVYHLAHFTWHMFYFDESFVLPGGPIDVYRMVVTSFQNVWIAGSYIVAMILVGLHLSHGIASFFQTLGFHHSK